MRSFSFAALLLALSSFHCSPREITKSMMPIANDVHSYANPRDARVTHLSLQLEVLFAQKTMRGAAVLTIEQGPNHPKELILDTRALQIDEVETSPDAAAYREAHFEIGRADKILGAPLRVQITAETKFVRIRYSTSPSATALQWLAPEQTAGKRMPFLYTQGEAIHTRSWIPLQDSPGVRITYDAKIQTPAGLKAVMSATNCPGSGPCKFVMDHPIAPYLIALAVGDLAFQSVSERTGVWAEPSVLPGAANEFSDMEKMLLAAEKVYGPYQWGRYDVLVLPPSFPFGGMENPRLTFATPTVLAGDKSLVSLVAHELAHSWSGNLVTNATWSDFWLNEGYTVYIERRILEELYGPRRAGMEASLGYDDLKEEMTSHEPRDQSLWVDLKARDPDEGMNSIPYEKGALFLRAVEQKVGREKFDQYLKSHFSHFAFQSITTKQATAFLTATLGPDLPIEQWVYHPGIPADAPSHASEALAEVDKQSVVWLHGGQIETKEWTAQEWQHFLQGLPRDLPTAQIARLDHEFHLTQTRNDEILAQWLLMAVRTGYKPADAKLEEFLTTVGRRKYVKPLYQALLGEQGQGGNIEQAHRLYDKARPMYHPITQQTIDEMMKKK